jgi:hypothetical protein
MAAELFDLAAELLESRSGLDRLESRGTLRLTLKSAGLDANSITPAQLRVVLEKLMPGELEKRGVDDAGATSKSVWEEIERSAAANRSSPAASLDETFRRLGGD